MQRIKYIVSILQPFSVIPLSPSVQPDWNQGKKGKTLPHDIKCMSKELQLIHVATQHFYIDVPQTEKLPYIAPPFSVSEKIKYKYS